MGNETDGQRVTTPPERSWLRTFMMVVLTVIIPLCLYYFIYAAWRAAETQRRNYRVLAAAAHDIADNGARRIKVLLSAVPDTPASLDPCEDIRLRVKNGGLLELAPNGCGTDDLPSPWERLEVALENDASESVFVLTLHRAGLRVRATALLRDVVAFNDANRSYFDALVVRPYTSATETGRVLVHNTDFPGDLIEAPPPAANADAAAAAATAGDAQGNWKRPDFLQFRDHPRSKIAKQEYVTFEVPVTIEVPAAQRPAGSASDATSHTQIALRVQGLVLPDRLRKQALALSANRLAWLVCAVIAAVLTLPYLKIRFMVRRERLRRIDLGMLAATALGGMALATLLISYVALRVGLRGWMDQRMTEVGRSMQDAAQREAALILRQLDAGGLDLARGGRCAGAAEAGGEGSFLLRHPGADYPDFEALYCTDRDSNQLRKRMPRNFATQMVPTAEYPYFRRALMMATPADATHPEAAFVFDRVSAKTTGLGLAIFAKPLDGRGDGSIGAGVPLQARTGVMVLATPMHSLSNAVLPQPFEYVVVSQGDAQDGQLLFPDGRRHEYFFAESEDRDGLRRLIDSGGAVGSAVATRSYLGRTYRMQAFALPTLVGPRLVVFYDTAYIDEIAAETILSSAMCLLPMLGLCLLAVFLGTVVRPAALDTLWPTVQHWPLYLLGLAAAAAFALAIAVAGAGASPGVKALALIAGPALGIFTFLLAAPTVIAWLAKHPLTLSQRTHRRFHPELYLAFATSTLLVLAALPTAFIVDDAGDAYVAAFRDMIVRTHADAVARRRAADLDRFVVVSDTFPTEKVPDVGERLLMHAEDFRRLRDDIVPFAYYETVASTFKNAAPTAQPAGAEDTPLPSGCRLFGFGGAGKPPLTYLAAWSAACLPTMTRLHEILSEHVWRIDQRADRGGLRGPARWVVIVLTLLLTAGAFLLVRSIAKRILGLDFEDDGIHDRHAEILDAKRPRWLLLRPTQSVLATVEAETWTTTLDLSQSTYDPKQIETAAAAGGSVLLKHLECRVHEAATRDAVRALIGSVAVKRLFLVSDIDPLHYLSARLGEGEEATDAEAAKRVQEIDAWAQALRTLEKARFAKPTAPAAPPAPDQDPVIVDRLHRECESSDILQGIESDLRGRSDFASFDWDGIVEHIQDVAEPHYRAAWGLCSEEEKLTLIHLAEEGVINPRNFDVLRRLRRRRLVRCDPRFRIINESFRRFVLEAETREQVRRWELPASVSTWALLRTPVLLLVVVVTGILVITQQGIFNDTLGIAAGATAAVGAVATVVAQARKLFTSSA